MRPKSCRRMSYGFKTSFIELQAVSTYASPSSSESSCRFCFLLPDFFALGFPDVRASGDAESALLIFVGASSSSSEEASPARARSSSSISAIVSVCVNVRVYLSEGVETGL
jgi:hypothetical protein